MIKLNPLSVILMVLAIFTFNPGTFAQDMAVSNFQIRLKGGIGQAFSALPKTFDDVTVKNPLRQLNTIESGLENTFLSSRWGPYGGINLDLYVKPRIGLGLDADLFFNKLKFIVPGRLEDMPIEGLEESNRKNQNFFFAGIGPGFKLFKGEHFEVDLNLRGGLGLLQMGSLDVSLPGQGTSASFAGARIREEILHYDYSKRRLALGVKAGLYVDYWFNSWLGLTAGTDLVHSFVSGERLMANGSYILKYKDPDFFNTTVPETFDRTAYFYVNNELDDYPVEKMNVNHFAISAGLVFRIEGSALGEIPGMGSPGYTVSGLTVECDDNNRSIGNVMVELKNNKNGRVIKSYSSADGSFTIPVEKNSDYTITAQYNMYKSEVQEISTSGLSEGETISVLLVLCLDQMEVGKTFIINNIYYDFDECDFRDDAEIELDRLVETMKKYPGMEIELSSHTDQRGAEDYNMRLSQCRAESVMDYLVDRGISKSRITPVGYGESRLLRDCSNEEGCDQTGKTDCPCHKNNRRTEVKILKL